MSELMRLYKAEECGEDGYPFAWSRLPGVAGPPWVGVKDVIRHENDDRCVRCLHPYVKGGKWSPCDERCQHGGPSRRWPDDGLGWVEGNPTADVLRSIVSAGVPVEARWRILTVHHLNGNKADLRWWNLTPLCQRCHLRVQGKVQMARVWPWEHSTWFEPYVAAYYALVYLGEELTREETMERLDELLALERAA
jgi:5-methylcytosine-specific restriction endonuclease McrA